MAKKKIRTWSEAELIDTFALTKTKFDSPLLKEWLETTTTLDEFENKVFSNILAEVRVNIEAWNEEDLKMNFIAFVISLANLKTTDRVRTYYEKTIEAEVSGYYLKIKCDFMVAKGILDMVKVPYFHFQEYKRDKDPYGDPMAQLIEAFLIAWERNKNGKPLYGCYVVGRFWYFVTFEDKKYCASQAFDSTDKKDLLQIIAILRKFKEILETRLLD
ncbi:MAG: hypothetical protein H7A23_04190 [Leptospiraceae bacterium]|nr:hypothetical protein [Leptospiraceae bacterium]MCP5493732.1 hypothetical protein [Leptospiraceae bacterium]